MSRINRHVKGMELYYAVMLIVVAGATIYSEATGQGVTSLFGCIMFLVLSELLIRALRVKRGDYE